MVARLRLTSSFKPREGVYRGLQTPQKKGVRHGQDFAGRPRARGGRIKASRRPARPARDTIPGTGSTFDTSLCSCR